MNKQKKFNRKKNIFLESFFLGEYNTHQLSKIAQVLITM